MQIFVFGSMAYDRIMSFPGKFSDHILPEKIHILNVCFLVDGLTERFGGTAGNIAYNLSLLDEKPQILSTVGKDFEAYEKWLTSHGLPLAGLRAVDSEFTAGAYITTDQADNQITGFNPGAMRHSCEYNFADADPKNSIAIISPGNLQDMMELPRTFREISLPYIFDPGQQITAFSGEQLVEMLTGSRMLVTNDYELELIMKSTKLTRAQILERTECIITTLGEKGSQIIQRGKFTEVAPAKIKKAQDPTGAGDAFRAGLIKGIALGKDLPDAALMGSVCASFCVEQLGTQEHAFTAEEFWQRYRENFGEPA